MLEIIFDSCQMSDQALAYILEGVKNQISQVNVTVVKNKKEETKVVNQQHLHNFIYANNQFGEKSLEQLLELANDLCEIRLNNIQVSFNSTIMGDLLDHMVNYSASPYLMKLALTNVNLNDDRTVGNLVDTLETKKYLQFLDLSWGGMTPRHLARVTDQMAEMFKQLREINLSYNKLNFYNKISENYEYSVRTVENLKTLLKKAKILNHVNFSGMDIDPNYLTSLCRTMSDCPLLMGIHLNDNGINSQLNYFVEVLDIFNM